MAIIGMDHVQVAMPPGGEAEAEVRKFYRDVLEMEEIPKPAHLSVNGGCWFTSGGAHIHLGVEAGFSPARKAHPALLVDDLAALVERLKAHGCDFVPGKPLTGYVRGDTSDPFGNRLELMQRMD